MIERLFELFLFFRYFEFAQYDKKTKKRVAKAGLKVNRCKKRLASF